MNKKEMSAIASTVRLTRNGARNHDAGRATIMKEIAAILIMLATIARAAPAPYYQVPGAVAKAWNPDTNQVQHALLAVEQYCRMELSDAVRKVMEAETRTEVQVTESNGTIIVSYDPPRVDTNAISKDFKVYGVAYAAFRKKVGPFLEDRSGKSVRFIAVQHWPSDEIRQTVKEARPFTVYFLVDTEQVGLNTNLGYGKGTILPIRYSPGPPYYISTAGF